MSRSARSFVEIERLTLWTMRSSSSTRPSLKSLPIVVRYSCTSLTTSSVGRPERICSSTRLPDGLCKRPRKHDRKDRTYLEMFLESLQYSRRTISRPLISVLAVPSSEILTAAYFFFCSSSTRANTLSRSISSNRYLSLTWRLKSFAILMASW